MPAKKTLSLLLALTFLLLLIIWMATGDVLSSREEAPESAQKKEPSLFQVETRWLEAEPFAPQLVLQGQLHADQSAMITAETSGRVTQILSREGEKVEKGQTLLALAEESRPEQLARLKAEVETRQAEVDAAKRLREANHLARTEYLRLKSSLLQIQAELKTAQLDLAHTRPQAPFQGYLEELMVEVGEAVQPGQSLARLVQTQTLKAEAQVPQQRIHQVKLGQEVTLEMLDGQQLKGEVSFIAQQADPATRSFRLEARLDNPEQKRLAGSSATLRVHLEPTQAHFLSAALLNLDDSGQLGVKHVNNDQQVEWESVELLSNTASGVWVQGLPLRIQLITLGGGFVEPGEQVRVQLLDSQDDN
ncbi:efflux RND transporter periplasmic adaptor subunit [Marinospirillum sp.]|uniref:efflux RND transporter periplasmic adaptor subunit n=1 Tax=Marinospirillum sp. TaxID=2183934 RepID=UPI00384C3B63